ncbi:MAG TPA: biotin carboxylase N-terminal domain-containing protein, partial [Steroidobacteraceae bacterium]|nr:biotin carboxylase N-terminal domain-containing protein [Steroidobacteraceae bacterium]
MSADPGRVDKLPTLEARIEAVIRKLLIANRGEIACRILRTTRRLGIAAAVVYSQADERALHVRLADEAWPVGPAPARESYLNARAILEAARRCRADAIHPGYGFLSENEEFAAACAEAGLLFIGPPPAAIAAMGEKSAAKERMKRAGVPVLEGYAGEDQSLETLEQHGVELGFPLIIKPSAGGGGKGMQIVRKPADIRASLETARRIAVNAFGDGRILIERYLAAARHVEVQVLADAQGHVLHLLDRDCSVQRRHQKLIEEAPAPGLDAGLRAAMAEAACTVAREVGYIGAGTVEMLLDAGAFYFMEMNTRLQVEHPVTEAITGLDLVEWQLRIASGEPLPFAQSDIVARGHAIEARVCAEDPARDFLPGAGALRLIRWPVSDTPTRESGAEGTESSGIRVDRGFETGDVVPPHYDSLLGKIVAH